MDTTTIPIYQPALIGNERKYVLDCLETSWISSRGPYIEKFEQSFSQKIGVNYAATVCNGTVALHLAAVTLGLGPGDEVIVPTLTYVATANAFRYAGATPVFVDSDPLSWQISAENIKTKISPRTKAICVVHLYGHPCDMEAIVKIAAEHDLYVIEDCAEAFGSRLSGRHVGGFGHLATFSFYGNKTITTGEGGMVVTSDETLIDRVRHLRGQGLAHHRQYWHDMVGYNYRMTNICAAIGLAQLEKIDYILERKRCIADTYKDLLSGLPVEIHGEHGDVFHSYWMVNILVSDTLQRDRLRSYLATLGIETRPVFFPVHTMPMYIEKFQRLPVAEGIARRGITLPSYPALTDNDISFICSSIRGFFDGERK